MYIFFIFLCFINKKLKKKNIDVYQYQTHHLHVQTIKLNTSTFETIKPNTSTFETFQKKYLCDTNLTKIFHKKVYYVICFFLYRFYFFFMFVLFFITLSICVKYYFFCVFFLCIFFCTCVLLPLLY